MWGMDDTSRGNDPQLRAATAADVDDLRRLNEAAFGYTAESDLDGPWLEAYQRPFSQVATISDQIVGAAAAFEMSLTLPGGAVVPCPGVTSVAVLPTHRRRGVLRQMMRRQLAEIRSAGASVAALTATEATIYEQFGYGVASRFAAYSIDTRRVTFRTEAGPGSMQLIGGDEARQLLRPIHDAKAGVRHGMTTRPDEMWDWFFADPDDDREAGHSRRFHVIHRGDDGAPDGYVSYRIEEREGINGADNVVHVSHLVGSRPAVEIDLWRFVCGLDLAHQVRALAAVDDPIRTALTDFRAVQVTAIRDHLWLRITDLAAALETRRYERDGEIVVGSVDWEFTNNTGQFRLSVERGRATVTRTEDPPAAVTDIATWGTMLLGDGDATHLALAGRLHGDPSEVNRFFRTSRSPWNDVDC